MARTATRRDELLAVAAELFATKGIASTTVRDIGEAAGVHSGSLYHHFTSKDAIVADVLRALMDSVHRRFSAVAAQQASPADRVRSLVRETLRVIDDQPHATAMYQNDRQYLRERGLLAPVDESSRAVRGYWMDAIIEGVQAGVFRADLPPGLFYRTVRDTLWATPHWPQRQDYATDELAEILADLFFTGFAS